MEIPADIVTESSVLYYV